METSTTCEQESLIWGELNYGGRSFLFSRGLCIRVAKEDGGWTFETDAPELIGFGDTREEAEQAFCQDFTACWDHLARERGENMDARARRLKLALLELAKEI